MFDPSPPQELVAEVPTIHEFSAKMEVSVRAASKMEAAHLIRLMIVSSAAPIRDFKIEELLVAE
jgi:hypothetical protein